MRAREFVTEKWTRKYKKSINCSNPKGFSQRAHCAGKNKKNSKVKESSCKTHVSTNGLETNMCPSDDDYAINYGENFADGQVKGKSRPGRVKRAGASCKGSVTDLRSKAKKSTGERGKMYHWCANMKSGRKRSIKEAPSAPSAPTGVGLAKNLTAMAGAANKPKTTEPGAQPKPLKLTGAPLPSQQQAQQQKAQQTPNSAQIGTGTAGQKPVQQQQAQQQVEKQQAQARMQQDAQGLAARMGMNPQQSKQFTQKITTQGSAAGADNEKQISPQDMQKALPKPGSNVVLPGLGSSKILPTPGDQKGLKLSNPKFPFPFTIDPRDLQ